MPNTAIFNSTSDINYYASLVNSAAAAAGQPGAKGIINPEVFYSKQLLDTIRYDADMYMYHRLADEAPIQEKADKLMVRRWSPLQAHTVPLVEGVPPKSDKGSVEKYEMEAHQYGRYMEFTDKVDFKVVDPIIAHYTKEYSLVALETLDLLARETLFSVANKYYANSVAGFEGLTVDSKPTLTDLRKIVLDFKTKLVKPRSNGNYHCIASPEFFFDMVSDPIVEKYMQYNNTTSTMYKNSKLVPMFDIEFYESLMCPTSAEFYKDGKLSMRLYSVDNSGTVTYKTFNTDTVVTGTSNKVSTKLVSGYVKDSRTGQDTSYIEHTATDGAYSWDIDALSAADNKTYIPLKAQHILLVGKDALTRTGLSGEGQAKMYVKEKGSSGVLDPIDQRQSIGFKINSVGYGCTRLDAVCDYICVPSQINI